MSWKIAREDERYYVDANTMPGAEKALRLAAAAPDLLEALEDLLCAYQVILLGAGQDRMCREAVKATRAAIAKAKGEE